MTSQVHLVGKLQLQRDALELLQRRKNATDKMLSDEKDSVKYYERRITYANITVDALQMSLAQVCQDMLHVEAKIQQFTNELDENEDDA